MADKFEQIMTAITASLSGLDATVERNLDVPENLETGTLIVVRDGQELSSERPLGGFQSTAHQHQAEIVIVVASSDAAERDADFSAACLAVRDALLIDPTFGGLVGGLDFGKPDGITDSNEGTAGVKAGVLSLTFFYTTDSLY